MPHYKRVKVRGGTYFFTVCTWNRQPILTVKPVRTAIAQAVTRVRLEQPFEIDAWVVLPDHIHCIWTVPPHDSDFSKRWSMIKRLVTQSCQSISALASNSRTARNEGRLWQRRFWEHLIRSDRDYRIHVDYIHWNPVKHGLVSSAKDWRYSSFSRFVTEGVYESDWGTSTGKFEGSEFGE